MRILLTHSRYQKTGGGENYVHSLMELLREKGHEVFLFAIDNQYSGINSSEFIFQDKFRLNEPNPFKFAIRYLSRAYFNPLLAYRLRSWIKKIKPDIIHIHANDRYGISVLIAISGLDIPVIQTIHANDFICLSSRFKKINGEFCFEALNVKCVVTRCISLNTYISLGIPYTIRNLISKKMIRLYIAPNPILKRRLELNSFKPAIYLPNFIEIKKRISGNYESEFGNLLCIGSLIEGKGFQHAIAALPEILSEYPATILHICGDGPYKKDLVCQVNSLNLQNNVVFHGFVENNNLPEFYQKSNAVIFPSLFLEVCPLVVLEALSFCRPVVASRFSGISEWFECDQIGYLVDPSNHHEIADSICRFLRDPARAASMGKNGCQLFKLKFSPEIHYEHLLNAYKSLIQKEISDNVQSNFS